MTKIYSNMLCALGGVLGLFDAASAYETPQHAAMTAKAFERSILTTQQAEIYGRLGFDRLNPLHPFETPSPNGCQTEGFPTQDSYAHPLPNWVNAPNSAPDPANVRFRCATEYDRRRMPLRFSGLLPGAEGALGMTPQLRFESWLMRGAIREDDISASLYPPDDAPDQDPWNDQIRVLNHFYSPVTNSSDAVVLGDKSALTWALGEQDPFAAAQIPNAARINNFTYLDARKNYFLALTYKRTNVVNATNAISGFNTRMALWASTLKSVGHVVHLLQDQASPQHSRGEPHNHSCTAGYNLLNQDIATRTYENYINYRGLFKDNETLLRAGRPPYEFTNACEEQFWLDMFAASGARPPKDPALWFSTVYPTPQFRIQRMFFTTRSPGDPTVAANIPLAQLNARAGLGDYANRGFFTQDYQAGSYTSPPPTNDPSYAISDQAPVTYPFNDNGTMSVSARVLSWRVPDPINPNFPDAGLDAQGRAPIISASQWCEIDANSCNANVGINLGDTVLTLDNYNQMADMLIPRAVAYSAGLIDFFFRGKLEIEPIPQRFFGVVDLGQPHTVNADGYPIITATNKILGFEKIRLKVRNLTDPIIESGTNANVPQVVGMGRLVAIARYHRNPCYMPDLSGERRVAYAPAPAFGVVTEPVCPMGLRTDFQEISVSAELPISAEADLPGGRGGTAPASLEKIFDFSADPIPVNATDLFIQVVYRGQLGEETDGIAVGNFDVQEPTFYAGWNNTDYYFNESLTQWLAPTATYPARVINGIRVCAGFPSKWVYFYNALNPQPGLGFPLGAASPGVVRLAFVFAKPATITQRYAVRSSPFVAVPPSLPERSGFTRGQERQASREIFSVASPLPAPSYCQLTPPIAGTTFWCFDPIKNRRGQNFGDVAQPLHYSSGTLFTEFPDVDAAPAQQILPGLIVRTGGENKFDESVLADCPAPAFSPQERRFIELREEAWSFGIDPDAVGKQP